MPVQCFQQKDSDPPICGVHHVHIVQRQIPIDQFAPGLGRVICSLCPVSDSVVQEVRGFMSTRFSDPLSTSPANGRTNFAMVPITEVPALDAEAGKDRP